jgi:FixJ family two-component response regulator
MTTQTIPAPTRKRILVVDDERFFREAIRDLLAEDGLECMVAATAAEALEAAQDPAVGVVVLDIQLPDQSGLAVLRLLRQQRPALRVVMLSAHTDQEYVLEALRQGACDYLAKPLHEEEVRLSVRRALDTYEMASGWESLRGRVGHLATELESLAAAGAGGEGEGIAGRAAEAVARLLDAGKTSVLLRDDRGDCLRVVATTGRKLAAGELGPVPLGEGVAGRAVAQGELIVVDDVERDPRFAPAPPERYESGSFVVLPLGSGPDRFGALCATDRSDGARFADEDVALLRLLALAVSPWLDPSRPLPGREAVGAAAGTPDDPRGRATARARIGAAGHRGVPRRRSGLGVPARSLRRPPGSRGAVGGGRAGRPGGAAARHGPHRRRVRERAADRVCRARRGSALRIEHGHARNRRRGSAARPPAAVPGPHARRLPPLHPGSARRVAAHRRGARSRALGGRAQRAPLP